MNDIETVDFSYKLSIPVRIRTEAEREMLGALIDQINAVFEATKTKVDVPTSVPPTCILGLLARRFDAVSIRLHRADRGR